MKAAQIFALALLVASAGKAAACQPDRRPRVIRQTSELQTVLKSPVYDQLMKEFLAKDPRVQIIRVTFEPEILIEYSNDCKVHFELEYTDGDPRRGHCPMFQGVKATPVCD